MQDPVRIKRNKPRIPEREPGPTVRKKERSHPLLKMQRSVGNQATLQLCGSMETLQTKLTLGKPNDLYEQEADSVAQSVVRQISQTGSTPTSESIHRQEEDEMVPLKPSEQVQRQDVEEDVQLRLSEQVQRQAEEEEEEVEEPLQSKNDSDTQSAGTIPTGIENQVQQERQGGSGMDAGTRSHMESSFGYDFSQVNIHNGSAADSLASQLNAEAFTLKNDIFFRGGRYDPESSTGQDLLAHELTHVVQQNAAPRSEAVTDETQ